MGGKGSGRTKVFKIHVGKSPSRVPVKKGVPKIFGLTDDNSDHYWYLGVTTQYVCKIKSYLTYAVKKGHIFNSRLSSKIKELNYKFNIVELEVLYGMNMADGQKYLGEHYLSKYQLNTDDCEVINKFYFYHGDRQEPKKPGIHKAIKKEIIQMFKDNYTYKEISEKYGGEITPKQVRNIVAYAGDNVKKRYDRIYKEFLEIGNISKIAGIYGLSEYHIEKFLERKKRSDEMRFYKERKKQQRLNEVQHK